MIKFNWKRLILENLLLVVLPYLLITMIGGVLINGFIILAYIALIPISVLASFILNIILTKKMGSSKWWKIALISILVGAIEYVLLWTLLEVVKFPFYFKL